MSSKDKSNGWIWELLNWVSVGVALIGLVVSLVAILPNSTLSLILGILLSLGIILSSLLYVSFSRITAVFSARGYVYRFSRLQRLSAKIGVLLILAFIIVASAYAPTRQFVVSLFTNTSTPTQYPTPSSSTPAPTASPDISVIANQVNDLHNEVKVLEQRVDLLSQSPSITSTTLITGQIQDDIISLDSRLGLIEKAILDNPERSLALALLSKDTQNMKAEVEHLYDLMKWFIGLMFTMALSLLGLALSNFIRRPEKTKETPESKGKAGRNS